MDCIAIWHKHNSWKGEKERSALHISAKYIRCFHGLTTRTNLCVSVMLLRDVSPVQMLPIFFPFSLLARESFTIFLLCVVFLTYIDSLALSPSSPPFMYHLHAVYIQGKTAAAPLSRFHVPPFLSKYVMFILYSRITGHLFSVLQHANKVLVIKVTVVVNRRAFEHDIHLIQMCHLTL